MPMPLHFPWGPKTSPHLLPSQRDSPCLSCFAAVVRSVGRDRMETRLRVAAAGLEMDLAVHWLDALMVRFEPGASLTLAATAGGLRLMDIGHPGSHRV